MAKALGTGPSAQSNALGLRRMTAKEVAAAQDAGALLVDLRPAVEFCACHCRGALHLEFNEADLRDRAPVMLARDLPLVVTGETDRVARLAGAILARAGFEVLGQLAGGVEAWLLAALPTACLPVIDVGELDRYLERYQVIDAREPFEYHRGHIAGALLLPATNAWEQAATVPDGELAVICSTGARATTVASLLAWAGHRTTLVAGGMASWTGSAYPGPMVPAPGRAAAGGRSVVNAPLASADVPVVSPDVAAQQALAAGLVVHRANPLNAETPLAALAGGGVVPSARFYVRNHFHIPDMDPATWRLRVGGFVERPLSLSLAMLQAMTSQTAVVTLECAGNGRSWLDPPVAGEQWGHGAVGTAEWTGVPLADVLRSAAPRTTAREAIFRGADSGPVEERDGPVRFERSLPIDQLVSEGALLAYAMNGEQLPAPHGFPLRLIMPGWYGVASVKWLTEIELIDRAFDGHFQVDRYRIDDEPITLQAVRSLIIEPRTADRLEPGNLVIRGLAWSGAAPIASVEVSIDDRPWQQAILTAERRGHGWQRWELPTRLERSGSFTIRARATDLAGRTQPHQPRWNPLGYASNHVHQVLISV